MRHRIAIGLAAVSVLASGASQARPPHPLQCDESAYARTCRPPAEAIGVVPHCSCKVLSATASKARQSGTCFGTCTARLAACNKGALNLCLRKICDADGFNQQSAAYEQCRADYNDCAAGCQDQRRAP